MGAGSSVTSVTTESSANGGIKVGSKVVIRSVTVAEATTAQKGHGGFASSMKRMLGKLGVVVRVDGDGDLHIRMEDGSSETFCWNPALVSLRCEPTWSQSTFILESSHPYPDGEDTYRAVELAGATSYSVSFDSHTSTEADYDFIR